MTVPIRIFPLTNHADQKQDNCSGKYQFRKPFSPIKAAVGTVNFWIGGMPANVPRLFQKSQSVRIRLFDSHQIALRHHGTQQTNGYLLPIDVTLLRRVEIPVSSLVVSPSPTDYLTPYESANPILQLTLLTLRNSSPSRFGGTNHHRHGDRSEDSLVRGSSSSAPGTNKKVLTTAIFQDRRVPALRLEHPASHNNHLRANLEHRQSTACHATSRCWTSPHVSQLRHLRVLCSRLDS